jgi:hypothetical protein
VLPKKHPGMATKSATPIMMSTQLEAENAASRRQRAGQVEEIRMIVAAILLSILAGFGGGYATRAWRSRRRRVRHPLYQPYDPALSPQSASSARGWRAF